MHDAGAVLTAPRCSPTPLPLPQGRRCPHPLRRAVTARPNPKGELSVSTLVLLVLLLLVLVGLMLVGALAYAVHRRPSLSRPLTVALTGAGVSPP